MDRIRRHIFDFDWPLLGISSPSPCQWMRPLVVATLSSCFSVLSSLRADEEARPDFEIQSTVVKKVDAVEPAPLAGMVPVEKEITITQHLVRDPGLADPVAPAVVAPTPEAVARWKELAALRKKRVVVHLSATVYDHQRTHLSWYFGGAPERKMEAWSALDFADFAGIRKVVKDGVEYEFMGIGMGAVDTTIRRRMAERLGKTYQELAHPDLPVSGTPFFTVTKGDPADVSLLAPITALHDLYETDGGRLRQERLAREEERARREAWIRANPPEPQDVTIHFWKRAQPLESAADANAKGEEEQP